MTLKELLWPHEYSALHPVHLVRYYTHRCEAGPPDQPCWRKAVHHNVVAPACDEHVNATINRVFEVMREQHKRRAVTDPLYRLESEYRLASYTPPPASVWWRLARRIRGPIR